MNILPVNSNQYTKQKFKNDSNQSFGINYTQGFKDVLARDEVSFAVKDELKSLIEQTATRNDGLVFDASYHEQRPHGPRSGVGFDTIFFNVSTPESEKPLTLYYYSDQTKAWIRGFFQDIKKFAQSEETDLTKPRNLIK